MANNRNVPHVLIKIFQRHTTFFHAKLYLPRVSEHLELSGVEELWEIMFYTYWHQKISNKLCQTGSKDIPQISNCPLLMSAAIKAGLLPKTCSGNPTP